MMDEVIFEAAPPSLSACGMKKKTQQKVYEGGGKKKKKESNESNPLILRKAEIQGHEKPLRWQAVFY